MNWPPPWGDCPPPYPRHRHRRRLNRVRPGADRGGGVIGARSVDIGWARMTERHLHDGPPSPVEVAGATADIDNALALVAANVPVHQPKTLAGLGGSVTTVAGIAPGRVPGRFRLASTVADAE